MEARERVILKSIDLFTQYGIRQVTMDQIASELGMSKRTIYEHFRDKDTLLRECLEAMNRQHTIEVNEILAGASNVIEALYRLGQHGENKKAAINCLFFDDLKKLNPGLWNTMKNKSKPGPGSFSYAILEKGVKQKIFRDDLNLELVDIFIHIIMESFHEKDAYPSNVSRIDILKSTIIPYYQGIATEKGKKLIDEYLTLL